MERKHLAFNRRDFAREKSGNGHAGIGQSGISFATYRNENGTKMHAVIPNSDPEGSGDLVGGAVARQAPLVLDKLGNSVARSWRNVAQDRISVGAPDGEDWI